MCVCVRLSVLANPDAVPAEWWAAMSSSVPSLPHRGEGLWEQVQYSTLKIKKIPTACKHHRTLPRWIHNKCLYFFYVSGWDSLWLLSITDWIFSISLLRLLVFLKLRCDLPPKRCIMALCSSYTCSQSNSNQLMCFISIELSIIDIYFSVL